MRYVHRNLVCGKLHLFRDVFDHERIGLMQGEQIHFIRVPANMFHCLMNHLWRGIQRKIHNGRPVHVQVLRRPRIAVLVFPHKVRHARLAGRPRTACGNRQRFRSASVRKKRKSRRRSIPPSGKQRRRTAVPDHHAKRLVARMHMMAHRVPHAKQNVLAEARFNQEHGLKKAVDITGATKI